MAIETTGRSGSLAVLSAETILWQSKLDPGSRTAASLGPEMDRLIRWCEKKRHPIGFVSVADGPGSFTGLRIGVTTAKTLAYALELPLVSVDSLAAIAAAVFLQYPKTDSLLVATNAYRGQVFCGTFTRDRLLADPQRLVDWTAHPETVGICEQDEWQKRLRSLPAGTALAGDSLPFGDLAHRRLRLPDQTTEAVGVGLLGYRRAICNDWADPFALAPRYLKPSAAEEKAAGQR